MAYALNHLIKNSQYQLSECGALLLYLNNQFVLIHTDKDHFVVQGFCTNKDWKKILSYAAIDKFTFVIMNAGLDQMDFLNDDIVNSVPKTTIGQLLGILYSRYCSKEYNCLKDDELTLLFSNLGPGKEEKLRCLFIELAHLNALDYRFLDWLETVQFRKMITRSANK